MKNRLITKFENNTMTGTGRTFDADEIFDTTARQHGLEKYVDEGMRQRFSHLMASFNDNGTVPDWSYPAALEQLSALVLRRLEIARDRALYPAIAEERVEQPFLVIGSGRTGTTAMQDLLAMGPGCRTPVSWECHRPSPPPGVDLASEATRIAIQHKYVNDHILNVMPGMLLSHPYIDQGAFMTVEDEELFTVDFHYAQPFHFTRVRNLPLSHHKRESGLVDALKFHKEFLQHLQWKRPVKHWVFKTAQHFFQLPATFEVYPDVTCVWTHRDPVVFVSSLLGILQHCMSTPLSLTIPGKVAHEIMEGLQAGYDAALNSDWIDDKRIIHIRFDDFVRDQVGTLRKIYESRGLPFTAEYEARIRAWQADPAHKSNRHGKFIYSPEEFGLDAADIRKRFAGYYEHFLK